MRQTPALYSFNRGIVSPLGLARVDQKRVTMAAETMTNWVARILGSMALRPGFSYLGRIASDNAARIIPFVFATNDVALVEFTNMTMRVWIQDALLSRSSVASAITNGTFSGNITGWTDGSDSGGAIAYQATNNMKITGNGTARGIGYQQVSVAGADQMTEHGLHVVISRGPVTFQVGTTLTGDDLVTQTVLDTGTYSFGFTPNAAAFYVVFSSTAIFQVQVQQCTIEASGTVTIASPYLTADLGNIRYDQSGDVVFLAASGWQQRKIERRGTRPNARSWGISLYHADDGPFQIENFTPTTITPSAATGDITLTASVPLFRPQHIGSIISITSSSAQQSKNIAAQNTFTSPSIKVTGVGANRILTVTITGTWSATVTVQQSVGVDGIWTDFAQYSSNQAATPITDGLDNQIVYYRIGVKTGDYTSGTANAQLNYAAGSQMGIVRVTSYTSNLAVNAQVLSALGGTTATQVWALGDWSDYVGWPQAVRFHEGRLWWSGKNGVWGSVSDGYFSFNENTLGDSGPINRTIGAGPMDTINWILSLQRMVIGTQGMEISVRSSALETPLTPTDFVMKQCSTQGSSSVDPVRIDYNGVYVDRTGLKVFQLEFDLRNYLNPDYSSIDLTAVVPELALPGIVRLAAQRKPDTRIHCVRSDGIVMLGILDRIEDVLCWQLIQSGTDLIEDVAVLPGANGSTEDQVYYVVNRVINGATVRHLEKWAKETECRGGTLNKQADAFIIFTNAPASASVTGLTHLIGMNVIVWADGKDLTDSSGNVATFLVDGTGAISLTDGGIAYSATTGIVGLSYTAQWKSTKLGIQPSVAMTTLNQQKRVSHLGLVAAYFHAKGVQYGPTFSTLQPMPAVEEGVAVGTQTVRTSYDEQEFVFPGVWDSDARLCLQATAPRPVTLMAAVVDFEIHD